MKHPSSQPDLSLLALRYAANELDAAESADFEQRLADDLEAQLALAQAVQIASAVQAPRLRNSAVAPSLVARPTLGLSDKNPRRWSPWLAALSGAVVAAAVLVALREESVPESANGALADASAAGVMVSGWSAVELESSSLLTTDDAALLGLDEESSNEAEVPDWLLAAVSGVDVPTGADVNTPASGDGLDAIDEDS